MALTRQLNVLGQQRIDVPDIRSIESAVANDFDLLSGQLMAHRVPLVVKGFTVDTTSSYGSPATALVMRTAEGILVHWGATEAGTLMMVPTTQADEALNASNPRVQGSFASNAVNYVGIDYLRSADETTSDTTKFLPANAAQEIARSVPKARTLDYRIIISTSPFSLTTNVCPILKVTTDSSGNVASVQDARNMMWRLAPGGDTPNPDAGYTWADATRRENPSTYAPPTTTGNPFAGGDKEILSLKDWINAIMNTVWEAKSGESWYSPTTRDGIKLAYGSSPVFGTGDNFTWDSGTGVIGWEGISVLFENSSGGYYNRIADGSATLTDGQCLYVDLDRTTANVIINSTTAGLVRTGTNLVTATTLTSHGLTTGQKVHLTSTDSNFPAGTKTVTVTGLSTFTYAESGINISSSVATTFTTPLLVAQVATLQTLAAPTIPGSRIIIAWRLGTDLHLRDRPFNIERLGSILNAVVRRYPNQFVSTVSGEGDYTTLAAACAALPAYGGVVVLQSDITLGSNVKLLGRSGLTITMNGCRFIMGDRSKVEDITFYDPNGTGGTGAVVVLMTGYRAEVTHCRFRTVSPATSATTIFVKADAAATKVVDSEFNGVVTPSTGTGIEITANAQGFVDDSNTYTS